ITSWGASGVLIIASFFLFADFLTTLICILFALLITTIIVDKQLDNLQAKVISSLAHALSSIRQEYMKTNSVVEALNDADIPDLIKRPMEEVATILTSNNSEL